MKTNSAPRRFHLPRPLTFLLTLILVGSGSVRAQETGGGRGHAGENNVLRLHVAQAELRGDGDYWRDKERTFSGSVDDFDDLSFTLDYQRMVGRHVAVMLSAGYYQGSHAQAYLDFAGDAGAEIVHTTTVERAALTAGALFYPLGRSAIVTPYFGGGFGAYPWRLEEAGEFIDFTSNPPRIFKPSPPFTDEEVTFGHFWIAGFEIPVASSFALFAEGRLQRAEHELGGDFNGFGELDLSSTEISAGASLSF